MVKAMLDIWTKTFTKSLFKYELTKTKHIYGITDAWNVISFSLEKYETKSFQFALSELVLKGVLGTTIK